MTLGNGENILIASALVREALKSLCFRENFKAILSELSFQVCVHSVPRCAMTCVCGKILRFATGIGPNICERNKYTQGIPCIPIAVKHGPRGLQCVDRSISRGCARRHQYDEIMRALMKKTVGVGALSLEEQLLREKASEDAAKRAQEDLVTARTSNPKQRSAVTKKSKSLGDVGTRTSFHNPMASLGEKGVGNDGSRKVSCL